jgi:hypothetical protein
MIRTVGGVVPLTHLYSLTKVLVFLRNRARSLYLIQIGNIVSPVMMREELEVASSFHSE